MESKVYKNPKSEAFQDFITNRDKVIGKTKEGHDVWFQAKPEGLSPESLKEAAELHRKKRDFHLRDAVVAKGHGMNYFGNGLHRLAAHHEEQAKIYENAMKKSDGVPAPQKAPIKEPSVPNVNKGAGKQMVRQPRFVRLPLIKKPTI